MSDLFHEDVPAKFIQKVFHMMEQAHWHRFQILTKRSERLLELNPKLSWNFNIWMGVSVENQEYTFRIDHLRKVGAKIKFISFEPLLGPIHDLNLRGIDWVIVGGESGYQARPWMPPGLQISATNVKGRKYHSSLNSGVVQIGRRLGESSKAEHGTKSQRLSIWPRLFAIIEREGKRQNLQNSFR